VQAALQQKPCAQIPDTHSPLPPQACPFGLSPHRPLALQTLGATQSAPEVAAVQLPLHVAPPHLNVPQLDAAGVVQTPAPSHVDAAVAVFVAMLHDGSLHTVPFVYFSQTPAMHLPVVPHVAWPMSLHTPAGSALPLATLVQFPTAPPSAHDWQEPLHAELQHTPCAQKLDWHSPAAEHDAPSGFFPHWLPLQTRGLRQLALVVHRS
jgi:hypothetical protein